MSDKELDRNLVVLARQWELLRSWIGELEDPADPRPSVLDGWSLGDLVAHLGRAMTLVSATDEAPDGAVALPLGDYVAKYPSVAEETAAATRDLAREISADPLAGVDTLATEAFVALGELGTTDRVVVGRRGPIMLSDLVLTRIIECVVHADDLARSLPGSLAAIDREALRLVAGALLDVLVSRTGRRLEVTDDLAWVRLACGRVPYSAAEVSDCLQPVYTSDSLPDLGRYLPLL